jgi:hypothetical protein
MARPLLAGLMALGLLGVSASHSAAGPVTGPVFTFDDLAVGTATPFSDTQGGVTASFMQDLGSPFVVGPVGGFGPPFMGNLLTNANAEPHRDLIVTFSEPVYAVALDFGLVQSDEPARNILGLTAYADLPPFSGNSTQVGQATAFGEPTGGGLLQGRLSFNSDTPFLSLFISSGNAPFFWADNLALNSAAVIPEPTGLTLAAVCIGALAVRVWRRRTAA